MRNRQGGMTLVSMLFITALVALIGYGIMRLVPVYLTEMKVKNIMSGLESEFVGQEVTAAEIMNTISKRLDIEMVTVPDRKDFRVMKTDGGLRVETIIDLARAESVIFRAGARTVGARTQAKKVMMVPGEPRPSP